jgi:hypothetical protein
MSDFLKGKSPRLTGDALQFYQNSVLLMKHSQNPTLGTFVASFHPGKDDKDNPIET